ncbi:MAG: polyphosphate polymerase domain-containing protein [Bacteroidota bacterium]
MERELRYERKFRIEALSVEAIQQIIRQHPAAFRKAFPDRQVNSIYLDSPDYNNWQENILGWNERKKYRIRWYGTNLSKANNPQLEIKSKHNELGWKEHVEVEEFNIHELGTVLKELGVRKAEIFQQVPKLLNSYERSYYISFDQRFRLTLDRNMCFYRLMDAPFLPNNSLRDTAFILELKYAQKWDDLVDTITQYLPFRQHKHSKYVEGIKLIS